MAVAKGGKDVATQKRGTSESLDALAARCCPRQSVEEARCNLVPPTRGRRRSADAARALAEDRVAAVVSRTCEWGSLGSGWKVGDYRSLVLSFVLKGDVEFYVQLWTEPEEPVLVEACSGAWNSASRPYIGPPQRAALRRLGYRVGGRARNFGKRWPLSLLADARALAAELVTILVDVFGYRATSALELAYRAGRRTVDAPVFPALGRDDVERMLRMGGVRLIDARPAGRVSPGVRRRLIQADEPFRLTIELKGEVGKEPFLYEAMQFITPIPGGLGVSDAQLAAIARACPFLRLLRDDKGEVLAMYDVAVAGTTVRWFLLTLHVVGVMRARAVSMVQEALAARHGLPRGRAGGGGALGDGVGGIGQDSPDPEEAAGLDEYTDETEAGSSTGPGRSRRFVVH